MHTQDLFGDPVVLPQERVGRKFSLPAMLHARTQTMQAVQRTAAQMRPGMTQAQAVAVANATLHEMGAERIWHRSIVRFGADTLKTFKAPLTPERVLRAEDIFFIDLGAVWQQHEGDAGATFTLGHNAAMQACAQAAHTLWQRVHAHWRSTRTSGVALYNWAAQAASAMGYVLNLNIKGHRVSDFPHAIYRAGDLGDFAACPQVGLWILEIQLRDPSGHFGAFYEDLLVDDTQEVSAV